MKCQPLVGDCFGKLVDHHIHSAGGVLRAGDTKYIEKKLSVLFTLVHTYTTVQFLPVPQKNCVTWCSLDIFEPTFLERYNNMSL